MIIVVDSSITNVLLIKTGEKIMMLYNNASTPASLDKFFIFIQSFFLIFFLFSLSSFAQVVIEERIEIGGITSKDNLKKGSSIFYKDDIPSGFIMPRSGMLQVFYGYLTHYDGPMPWYSTLNTYFFKDDSTRTDELTPRFTDYFYWQRNFPFCNPSTRWEWDYFPEEEYLYDVDRVTEGDTVQFTYFSDWVASQDTFTYGVYSATEIWVDSQLVGWDMLFGNYDWCMEEFDNVLYISVGVVREYELMVSIEPDEISPGDTANVIIKKMLPDSTIIDFDISQTFEVAMLEGCVLGNILVGDSLDAYFYDVYQPIKFVVADSLEGDSSGVVLLRVGVVEQTLLDQDKITDNRENYCFIGNFNSSNYKDKSFPVGPTIKLLSYANGEPILKINGNEPAMPEFPIQLEISNDTRGNFDFLRYYLFLEWKNTQQTGDPMYGGGVTKLVQLPPGVSPVIIDFDIDWNQPNPGFVCGGDDLTFRVEYKGVKKDIKLNTDILGDNPVDKTPVVNYLDTKLQEPKLKQMKVIVYKENSWKQFKSNGYCKVRYYGSDAAPDWGMCQLNKETPTIGEIWNWKENVNSGITHLDFCYTDTDDFYNRRKEKHPDAVYFTNDELLIMTAQRYNKGRYYADWIPYNPKTGEQGHWRKNRDSRFYKYGDDFWYKYTHNIY
jgi:hypothetical protein